MSQKNRDPHTPWDGTNYDEIRHILDLHFGLYVMVGLRTIGRKVYAYPLVWDDASSEYRRYDIVYDRDLAVQQIEKRTSEYLRREKIYFINSSTSNLPHRPLRTATTVVTI